MGQVPLDRLLESRIEILLRTPGQLALDLAGINGVAQIVAGAVGNESLEFAVAACRTGTQAIENAAECIDDLHIGPFGVAADAIGGADLAALEHNSQRPRVVVNIK